MLTREKGERRFWEECLDGLGVYLRELQRKEKKHVRRKTK